jgi:hypothetical protein
MNHPYKIAFLQALFAKSKPIEFDGVGILHNSKFITYNSPQASEALGYGE